MLAGRYGRYGYRRVTALLHCHWLVGEPQGSPEHAEGRVERIWRREGLKVRRRQPKQRWPGLSEQARDRDK